MSPDAAASTPTYRIAHHRRPGDSAGASPPRRRACGLRVDDLLLNAVLTAGAGVVDTPEVAATTILRRIDDLRRAPFRDELISSPPSAPHPRPPRAALLKRRRGWIAELPRPHGHRVERPLGGLPTAFPRPRRGAARVAISCGVRRAPGDRSRLRAQPHAAGAVGAARARPAGPGARRRRRPHRDACGGGRRREDHPPARGRVRRGRRGDDVPPLRPRPGGTRPAASVGSR